jgi:hypothetical protein
VKLSKPRTKFVCDWSSGCFCPAVAVGWLRITPSTTPKCPRRWEIALIPLLKAVATCTATDSPHDTAAKLHSCGNHHCSRLSDSRVPNSQPCGHAHRSHPREKQFLNLQYRQVLNDSLIVRVLLTLSIPFPKRQIRDPRVVACGVLRLADALMSAARSPGSKAEVVCELNPQFVCEALP